ncbi:sensor histidine kinase [Methylorubrum thiocyanatum]|uniref:histidine kinase n=1 Tax=Methylorubrum thiocyanatum TaxID=47958 RepID=A0AA40V998_9HYPH|nr:ATP-binding protein [Methylorubrum thiocyanatum]MBA8910950.1 signal transduction histidine kinase [Methylorubrum thiocyanatum]GJE83066.1 Adaptive-response sensory-kinase SasA [Methylorubrum thiocyanatum]
MSRLVSSFAFRWALAIALWSTLLSLLLFAFVYWQTAAFMQDELAQVLRHEAHYAAREPAKAVNRIETWISEDLHSVHFAGLFGADGSRLAGNLDARPPSLPVDGEVHRIGAQVAIAGRRLNEELWSAAVALNDGSIVVVAHDTDEIDRAKATVIRALGLALVPTMAFSILGGVLLAGRARRRLASTEAAVAQVMRGDLRQRLPVGEAGDEFDRLARDVNGMLAEIERLVEEVRGVGDAVAHDLRTPLTRLRLRLERGRDQARDIEELRQAVDQGLVWIDQTLEMVTAVLRIGEIEHGRRCAAFGPVDLRLVVSEAAELFEPLADEKGIALGVRIEGEASAVRGDRSLIFEAISNLLDNAIKFTPTGGRVGIGLARRDGVPVVSVEDTGPGIPADERNHVFKRFYRAERARQTQGNGLGLGLVAAIAKLHGFPLSVGDGPHGGCRFEMACPALERHASVTG